MSAKRTPKNFSSFLFLYSFFCLTLVRILFYSFSGGTYKAVIVKYFFIATALLLHALFGCFPAAPIPLRAKAYLINKHLCSPKQRCCYYTLITKKDRLAVVWWNKTRSQQVGVPPWVLAPFVRSPKQPKRSGAGGLQSASGDRTPLNKVLDHI